MLLKSLSKTMLQQIHRSFVMMGLLLLSSCAVQIKDEQFCSPVPNGLGAVCDNFLTSNPLVLNQTQWEQLQLQWQNSGEATECTQSKTLGDIKEEIEKLCSMTKCDYDAKSQLLKGLEKIQNLR